MSLVTVPHAKEEMRLLLLSSMEMMSLIHCTVVYGLLLCVVCICVSSQELNHGPCHKAGKIAFVGEKGREEEESGGEGRGEEERGREQSYGEKKREERRGEQKRGGVLIDFLFSETYFLKMNSFTLFWNLYLDL